MRAQSNLPALAVALVLLTTGTVTAVALGTEALGAADRDPAVRHAAVTVADRLVAADAPTSRRRGVLDGDAVDELNRTTLASLAPAAANRSVRVRLDGETVLAVGDPDGGATVRRVVRVARPHRLVQTVDLAGSRSLRLHDRTDRVSLTVRPGPNTTVTAVRANGRVVLSDARGLDGTATVPLSRRRRARLTVDANDGAIGWVGVEYTVPNETAATLEVTVGA
ncbi:MAG: hypothetical protein ABEJ22_05660 [Haloferacaceae archaeon]